MDLRIFTEPQQGATYDDLRRVARSAEEHYTMADSPALPLPVQRPRPPVVIGGRSPERADLIDMIAAQAAPQPASR